MPKMQPCSRSSKGIIHILFLRYSNILEIPGDKMASDKLRCAHKYLDKHSIKNLGHEGQIAFGICKGCGMPFVKYGINATGWIPLTKADGELLKVAYKLAGSKFKDSISSYVESDDYRDDSLNFLKEILVPLLRKK